MNIEGGACYHTRDPSMTEHLLVVFRRNFRKETPRGFAGKDKKHILDDRLMCYWLRVLAKLIGFLDGNEAHSLSRSSYIHANIHNTQHETSSVENNSSCEATAE